MKTRLLAVKDNARYVVTLVAFKKSVDKRIARAEPVNNFWTLIEKNY